uniref:DUF6535 domain-containing protein n=1 Tax=Moniliophthora roreri TaxID=221103 RepID=A0A0W0FHY2_MONRR
MSSGDLAASHSLSLCASIAGTSRSQECADATQIPLPPSETDSVREHKGCPLTLVCEYPRRRSTPARVDRGHNEYKKAELTKLFLQEVAWHDPYITKPDSPRLDSTKNAEEDKKRAESMEKLLKEVARHDEDMVKGWRDDIDTLLVFAGLFSAVITAFAIESYKWLDEDPANATATLLTQLILVQVNGSQTTSFEPAQFRPDASSIRVNVFWFLSLILSLTSALFGLLCKQWVREHQRDTTTRTPGEALSLRQLRRDSFEKWGVSSFLSALPILLEVALLFFFVGVLDLLWNRHPVPFAICFVAVSLSAGLYLLTTLLPTLMVPRDQKSDILSGNFDWLSYQFICPYKSPQAWMIYRLSSAFLHPLLKIPVVNDFLHQKSRGLWDHVKSPASDWSSFDLRVVRQFDQRILISYGPLLGSPDLKVYELRAFEWAVTMFRDIPSMIPHLQNVLRTIPPSVAVSAVLGRWDRTIHKVVSVQDVEDALRYPDPFPPLHPTLRHPVLQHPDGINLLFHHQYWANMAAYGTHSTGLRFVIPFSIVDALWTHRDPTVRAKSLPLLSLFEQFWRPCPGYDEGRHDGERRAFMQALADHLNRTDRVSGLLTSIRGQAFIRFIHNEAITRRLLHHPLLMHAWPQAIKRAHEVGGLPSDYFAPIPQYPWDDLPTLPNLDPVRYSIETERDVRVIGGAVLSIATLNGMGDAIGADPSEGGLIRHLHNVEIKDNASLEGHDIDSPGSIAQDHESRAEGVGRPIDKQKLDLRDSMKGLGLGKRIDGILGSPSGQGDEDGDIGGDSYRLFSLMRQAIDIQSSGVNGSMGQPTHHQGDCATEDDVNSMNRDNAQSVAQDLGIGKRINTGTLGDSIEQGDEVGGLWR